MEKEHVYDFFSEFTRQRVPLRLKDDVNEDMNGEHKKWRISEINKDYKYCPTYPRYFMVPSSIRDQELEVMAASNSPQPFRSKARIPVLTYFHGRTQSVIMRSSQPMTGMGGLGGFVSTSWGSQNRCIEDEALLSAASIGYIVDARPKMNAVVNQAAGGGYENTADFYKGMELIFGNIQNIHKVRESMDAMNKSIRAAIQRHDHSLHVPHIKFLRIGHKEHGPEHKEEEHLDGHSEHDHRFGVSSNQPYDGQLIAHCHSPKDAVDGVMGNQLNEKMGAKNSSFSNLAKSLGNKVKSVTIKSKKSRSLESSPRTERARKEEEEGGGGGGGDEEEQQPQINSHSNSNNGDLYAEMMGPDNFWNAVASSSWFSYLRQIIVSSVCIVSMIDTENRSVLVHCSDGWDRTSQLCSLSQVLLDPYFRTIRGLCCLIEKDWISFGHKFHERFGHVLDDNHNDQRSPVFIQFLDALHQILSQFPSQFEYKSETLSFIAYHTTSCLYGTFLSDSEFVRLKKLKLQQRTASIWDRLLDPDFLEKHALKNKKYRKSKKVLYVDHRSINLSLWDYFTKMDPFPLYHGNRIDDSTNTLMTPHAIHQHINLNKKVIDAKQKDLEIKRLRKELEAIKRKNQKLKVVEKQYHKIMKCIDTKNGFLLQDQLPIIPDLDYVSVQNNLE